MPKEEKPLNELQVHGDVFIARLGGLPQTISELNFVCDDCGHDHQVSTQYVVDNWPLDTEITPRCRRCGETWSERFIFRDVP